MGYLNPSAGNKVSVHIASSPAGHTTISFYINYLKLLCASLKHQFAKVIMTFPPTVNKSMHRSCSSMIGVQFLNEIKYFSLRTICFDDNI